MKNQIGRNLFLINSKIKKTQQTYGNKASRVNLIAVSKTVSSEKIREAIDAGCKSFGENYIKEAKEKWPAMKVEFSDIKLHFIGNLQSNKAGDAVDLFDFIHTLDSQKLALALKKESEKKSKNPQIFIFIWLGSTSKQAIKKKVIFSLKPRLAFVKLQTLMSY
jgi:uncharacterized pyridoxal phosphate-containing UPF0001 family protein